MSKSRNGPTAGGRQELAVAVAQLHEEVRLLRTAVDELRDDVVWAARNVLSAGHAAAMTPMPLVPRDPLAPDAFLELPGSADACEYPRPGTVEAEPYCCPHPQLVWLGDAASPSIQCVNCGYLVADSGDTVIWRDAGEDFSPQIASTPPDLPNQKSLFDPR